MIENDILTLAAIVAAFVGVVKGFGLQAKYSPAVALVISAIFVLVPPRMQSTLITICIIGLTASGAYHYTKNRKDG